MSPKGRNHIRYLVICLVAAAASYYILYSKYPVLVGSFANVTLTRKISHVSLTPFVNESKKLLCVGFTGRLGNEMFEFASTLGLALTMDRTPVFRGSVSLPKVLQSFRSGVTNRTEARCQNASGQGESSCCTYRKELAALDPTKDFKIGLYLQSYRYFLPHQAAIRQALTFNQDIRREAGNVVSELRRRHAGSTLVAVHVRLGDLIHDQFKNEGYRLPTPEYLGRAVDYFHARFPSPVFVVGSDSVKWCRDNFPNSSTTITSSSTRKATSTTITTTAVNVTFLEGHSPAVDLTILALLDHSVLTFGTFSWWVGFLGAGTSVYMKDFIMNGTNVGRQFHPNGTDYIYPGWVPL